jgi:hypothetical protein
VRIRVVEAGLELADCRTRTPFRFGIHTLTVAPHAVATVRVEASTGEVHTGHSAELLVPRWFEKNPERSIGGDIASLIGSARGAAEVLTDGSSGAVFDHAWRMIEARVLPTPVSAPDRLTRGFGCALWERALIDAVSRGAGLSFPEALEVDLFRFEPARIHPELEGLRFSPAPPPARLAIRHTVGLLDPLDAGDRPSDAPEDGLPVTLAEDIRRHGLRWFKLKVGGDPEEDRERLGRIAAVLERESPSGYGVTLDGNEQYPDPDALVRVLRRVGEEPAGARLLASIRCIEQPVPRGSTFDPAAAPRELSRIAPVIIDEADHGPEAFPAALALGYRGVSMKTCKGVFRSITNHLLAERRGDGAFLSAEDLTHLAPWGLQQDLLTAAVLGLAHVEKNGHHYFRGLDHLPSTEVEALLARHPDLYRPLGSGGELAIEDGSVAIGSLSTPGFACAVRPHPGVRIPADDYEPPEDP